MKQTQFYSVIYSDDDIVVCHNISELFEYIKNYGFGSKTKVDLIGESSGIVFDLDKVGPVELATMSFGQSISVTPMQLIRAISTIANDGKMMQPRVVKGYTDNKGNKKSSIFKVFCVNFC